MVNFFWRRKKTLIVMIIAVILTTAGIKASDRVMDLAASVGGKGSSSSQCPQDMVFISSENGGFCIDKYEASAGSDCAYSNPIDQTQTRTNLNNSECAPVSAVGVVPWRNISQDQAVMACAKVGKRLPTNEEWFQASLGTPDPASSWGSEDCHVSNNWADQPGLSGSGSKCVSSAGVYDMIGNVWEWASGAAIDGNWDGRSLPEEGFVDGTDGQSLPGQTNPDISNPNYNEDYFWIHRDGIRGFLRGGYWNNKSDAGQYSVYLVFPPSQAGAAVGFRCVK